jgi:hypothetical protein
MYEETVTTGGNLCRGRPRINGRAPSFCCLLCRGRSHRPGYRVRERAGGPWADGGGGRCRPAPRVRERGRGGSVADPALARINAPYAHTYVLEDSYLATLASDLGDGMFSNLPNTQDQQRLAIIEWRIALEVAASQVGYVLPADLQQAGRGEIAPGLNG